jgi:hypothetical protein
MEVNIFSPFSHIFLFAPQQLYLSSLSFLGCIFILLFVLLFWLVAKSNIQNILIILVIPIHIYVTGVNIHIIVNISMIIPLSSIPLHSLTYFIRHCHIPILPIIYNTYCIILFIQ